jgi:hypothetical protein
VILRQFRRTEKVSKLMNMLDLAGTWWVAVIVLSTTILGAGLGYGIWASRHAPRDARTMRVKDAATRRNFEEGAVEERPLFKE